METMSEVRGHDHNLEIRCYIKAYEYRTVIYFRRATIMQMTFSPPCLLNIRS